MLTNRKKLKNRRKKIKAIFLSTLFVLLTGVFLGYLSWTTVFSKAHYISPLASKVLSADSSLKQEKEIKKLEILLKEKQIEFVSISTTGTIYLIRLKNDAEVIISSTKDLNTQISSLQFILSRLTMEARQFSRLDLVFDKPVIVFK